MDELSAIEQKILALKAELSQLEAKRLRLIASKEMDISVSNESFSGAKGSAVPELFYWKLNLLCRSLAKQARAFWILTRL